MPERDGHTTPESNLLTGAQVSAASSAAAEVSYWHGLMAAPGFILTPAEAASQAEALDSLRSAIIRATTQAPDRPIVIAEGWCRMTSFPLTSADLALWHKKTEVYHSNYLDLLDLLSAEFPDLDIQAVPLASKLAELLQAPILSDLTPADLFTPEAPQGSALLTGLAGLLVATAHAPAALPQDRAAEILPNALNASADTLAHLAFASLGSTLAGPASVTDFIGTEGDDLIDLSADLTRVEGGAGTDTLAVAALSETASITFGSNGRVQLDLAGRAPVVLQNVERIAFEDGTLAFDDDGLAGQAYRLYQACFDRTPDIEGLGFWIKQLDAGNVTLTEAANFFIGSEEFANVYGAPEALADVHYLALLYANVLDRLPDSEGFGFWREQQENGVTRADMLVYFSESTENIARVATAIDDGIWYV